MTIQWKSNFPENTPVSHPRITNFFPCAAHHDTHPCNFGARSLAARQNRDTQKRKKRRATSTRGTHARAALHNKLHVTAPNYKLIARARALVHVTVHPCARARGIAKNCEERNLIKAAPQSARVQYRNSVSYCRPEFLERTKCT